MAKQGQNLGKGMVKSRTAFGQEVRRLRLAQRLSQSSLATRCGFSQERCSKIEIGKVCVTEQEARQLAWALGIPADRLLKIAGPLRSGTVHRSELGQLLYDRRRELGLTRAAVAERLGISPATVANRESNQSHRLTPKTAKRIATALEMPVDVLVPHLVRRGQSTVDGFGHVVRSRRQKLFLSLAEVAQTLGISRQFLSLIELGHCRARKHPTVYRRLCELLDIPESDLPPIQRRISMCSRIPGSVGEFITRRRIEMGLTQRELAQRLCINPANLSHIECGRQRVPRWHRERFVFVLHCSPEDLQPRTRRSARAPHS